MYSVDRVLVSVSLAPTAPVQSFPANWTQIYMSIHGTLKTMSVSDLLQFLESGRKTGTLKIARGAIVKKIYLERGAIVGSKSNDPKELLGQVLLHYGKIVEDQLQSSLVIQRQLGGNTGLILAAPGDVTTNDVMEAL